MGARAMLPAPRPVADPDAEVASAARPLDSVAMDLAARSEGATGEAVAVLEAQSL